VLDSAYECLLDRIIKPDGSEIDLWAARDALVLKALSIVLGQVLPRSSRCTHVKDHGGSPAVAPAPAARRLSRSTRYYPRCASKSTRTRRS